MSVRACILGAGFMARTHGKNLVASEDVVLAGICDPDRERSEACAREIGAGDVRLYSDFEDMLTREAPDLLIACIPPFAHAGQVEMAAAKGIHLFLEKPLALDVGRCQSMVDAAERAGVVTQVGYHMRFRRSVRKLKAMVAQGTAGLPTQFQGRYWCNMDGAAWWRLRDRSGGQVLEQTIHLYDLAMHFLGTPESVSAAMSNLCHAGRDDYTIEDTSAALVRFRGGAVASISGSNCAQPMHFSGDFRVVCGNAMLDYRTTGQNWVTPDSATLWTYAGSEPTREEIVETDDAYRLETEHFLACVRSGHATAVPICDGLESLRLVLSAIASARAEGACVSMDRLMGSPRA